MATTSRDRRPRDEITRPRCRGGVRVRPAVRRPDRRRRAVRAVAAAPRQGDRDVRPRRCRVRHDARVQRDRRRSTCTRRPAATLDAPDGDRLRAAGDAGPAVRRSSSTVPARCRRVDGRVDHVRHRRLRRGVGAPASRSTEPGTYEIDVRRSTMPTRVAAVGRDPSSGVSADAARRDRRRRRRRRARAACCWALAGTAVEAGGDTVDPGWARVGATAPDRRRPRRGRPCHRRMPQVPVNPHQPDVPAAGRRRHRRRCRPGRRAARLRRRSPWAPPPPGDPARSTRRRPNRCRTRARPPSCRRRCPTDARRRCRRQRRRITVTTRP